MPATLTPRILILPYVRLQLNDRLQTWVMGGLGRGAMQITQGKETPIETDISMRMGAVGATGTVLGAHHLRVASRSRLR